VWQPVLRRLLGQLAVKLYVNVVMDVECVGNRFSNNRVSTEFLHFGHFAVKTMNACISYVYFHCDYNLPSVNFSAVTIQPLPVSFFVLPVK
jgi:hypothetical protein